MKCPRCDSSKMRVVDSREGVDGRSVRRRRECEACEFRFTTFERIEESLPMVVKKGGGRESFDRYKVLAGMKRACEKRPVSVLDLEESIKQIETQLLECGDKEVSSESIGALVSERLKQLDQVAYVRFASVYREFSDVKEFVETLSQLGEPVDFKGASKVAIPNGSLEISSSNFPPNVLPLNVATTRAQGLTSESEKGSANSTPLTVATAARKRPNDSNLTLIDK